MKIKTIWPVFPLRVISLKDPAGLQRDRRSEKERQNKNYKKKKIITPIDWYEFHRSILVDEREG